MRGAIDIGSNSIRLAISNGTVESNITKLADGLSGGFLSPAGVEKTISVLSDYVATCKKIGCTDIYAFATEAVRKAADGKAFAARVLSECGLTVHILTEKQEAELALLGADKPDGAATVCDLGGGSMEVVCAKDGKTPSYAKSLPLGVVVMKNRFNGDYRKAIDEMPALVAEYGALPSYPVTISGGSACAIAAALLNLKVYDKARVTARFSARELDDAMPLLLSDKLSVFRPVCRKRRDTIPYGAIVIQALLNHAGAGEFYVSDSGNLEAVLRTPKFFGNADAKIQ